jgi:hypothetical protein
MQIRVRGIDANGEPQDVTVNEQDAASLGATLAGWKYALMEDGDGGGSAELSFSLAERRRTWR